MSASKCGCCYFSLEGSSLLSSLSSPRGAGPPGQEEGTSGSQENLGQLTLPIHRKAQNHRRDGAGFWGVEAGTWPLILPSLRGRKGRFSPTPNPESQNPGDTFKPCRFLVPHSGKGNRKSWVKKKSAHPPERPTSGQSSGLLRDTGARRRSNGGTLVLEKGCPVRQRGKLSEAKLKKGYDQPLESPKVDSWADFQPSAPSCWKGDWIMEPWWELRYYLQLSTPNHHHSPPGILTGGKAPRACFLPPAQLSHRSLSLNFSGLRPDHRCGGRGTASQSCPRPIL